MVCGRDGGSGNRCWHATGMWFRSIVLAAALLAPWGVAGRVAAEPAGATPSTTTPAPEPVPDATDNPFIPENANLGDCVSSLPRPECGSTARGGTGQWLVLGALLGGLGFIGWRVSRGIRHRGPTPRG